MGELKFEHDVDPREALLAGVGSLDDMTVFLNKVIIATYERPQKTKGGIIMLDSTRQEDHWRGAIGLVVKIGPTAFVDDHRVSFGGFRADAGAWVVFRKHSGMIVSIHGTPCRIVEDTDIWAMTPDPDAIC